MSDYFIFDDIDTRDYDDVYVYFDKVDETPKRVYETVEIPGRNGSLYIDENRYEDVEHVYHIVALTKEAGSELINALASKTGYYRLEDSFNPDEFYSAVFTSGAEPKISSSRDKNTFKITFTRKPQRWLKSGEKWVGAASEIDGNWTFDSDNDASLARFEVEIAPMQAGVPSPTNRAPISEVKKVKVYIADALNGKPSEGTYEITVPSDGRFGTLDIVNHIKKETHKIRTITSGYSFYDAIDECNTVYCINNTINNSDEYSMCEFFSTQPSETEPYVQFGRYEYSGGWHKGLHFRNITSISGVTDLASFRTWFSSIDGGISYVAGDAYSETSFTVPEIELLEGTNYIWAECVRENGIEDLKANIVDFSVAKTVFALENPTRLDSSPIIRAAGTGRISIGDRYIDKGAIKIGGVELTAGDNNSSQTDANDQTTTELYRTSLLNNGDTITVKNLAAFGTYYYSKTSLNPHGSGAILSCTGIDGCGAGVSVVESTGNFYVWVNFPDLTFSYGTSASYTVNTSWQARLFNPTTSRAYSPTMRLTVQVVYNGSGLLTYTITSTLTNGDSPFVKILHYRSGSGKYIVVGDSSKDSGSAVYADCDIGEFYQLIDGEYVSVNNNASFSSDLPVLRSGINEITCSNTITDIDIMPRWWRV